MRNIMAFLTVCLCTGVAFAQFTHYRFEGEATWWWEASIDNRATWTSSLLEVPQGQSVVNIRASCAFPTGPSYYFAGARIDQTITGIEGAGIGDTVVVTDPGFANQQTLVPRRFGSVLKIDDTSDTLPPGEGPGHWGIFQPGAAVGGYTYANPVLGVIDFDLYLDGTLGDRQISAWWRGWADRFPGFPDVGPAIYILNHNAVDFDFIFPALTVNELTIRVVPAPGTTMLACAVACLAARRRRPRS